jgi:hypothetical protein
VIDQTKWEGDKQGEMIDDSDKRGGKKSRKNIDKCTMQLTSHHPSGKTYFDNLGNLSIILRR